MRSTTTKLIGFGLASLLASPLARAGDFNGDGYEDLAIGVPNEDVGPEESAGAVIVIYGSAGGLRSTIASGAPIAPEKFFESDTWWPGVAPQAFAGFGTAVADGDFDGDGFDDLAISSPYRDLGPFDNTGQVYMLFGSPLGLGHLGAATKVNRGDFDAAILRAHDQFGMALATGDFDGDGDDDLAIGCPYVDIGRAVYAGAVYWCMGIADESFLEPYSYLNLDKWFGDGTAVMEDHFGWALTVGDFDNDEMDDLAIGAPNRSHMGAPACGVVYETHGGARGDTFTGVALCVQSMFPGSGGLQADAGFGTSLACGDWDGNFTDDLAVGAPYQDRDGKTDCGVVFVTGGTTGVGLTSAWDPDQVIDQDRFGLDTTQAGDNYGAAVLVGDFGWAGGDGGSLCDDLVVGCPGQKIGSHTRAGMLHVLPGDEGHGPGFSDSGFINKRWHQNTAGILESAGAGDAFASALGIGDFNGDGYDDLAIGIPLEDVGTTMAGADAGSVQIIYSHTITEPGTVGLHATGNQLWHQGSAGVPGSIAAGKEFGEALQR